MKIKFSPNEQEIIQHRLDVPDALEECLTDDGKFTAEQVQDSITHVTALIKNEFDANQLTICERDVLLDCVEGCTFFGSMDDAVACGDYSKGKAMADHKAAYSIERKLASIGITCVFPRF